MKYLAAYLLAGIGGKAEPSVGDLEKILGKMFVSGFIERSSSRL